MILALVLGCRPDPAPAELEQLSGYLFAHFDDEDSWELEDGVQNLDDWLLDPANEIDDDGFEVDNLPQEVVDSLSGERTHTVDGAVGAAVSDPLTHGVDAVAVALVRDDQEEVFEGVYTFYERTFHDAADCFLSRECERLAVDNDMIAEYGGLITVETLMRAEYRWVELGDQHVLLQRNWLIGDSVVSVDWASVDEQYFFMAMLPRPDGGLRMQAIWIKAQLGDDAAPESAALTVMVNSMKGQSETLQEYLDQ
ncbi:MAG: hypothetical protein GY913_21140 [Proteobacteria bacterium]|nr:hypothetical protein [Pseudomonadota bacterium]MCP4919414.1 hypothetical protein [Pseudomonadota bacterium]